jgi:aspartate racemase
VASGGTFGSREETPLHIGLIGGIGPAATSYYYLGLTRRAAEAGHALELTIAHAQMSLLIERLLENDPLPVAKAYRELTDGLRAAGADRVAVTSMGGHFCINEFLSLSPIPVINAIPEVADGLKRVGCSRVGLMGTAMVMNSRLYGGLPEFDVLVPDGSELEETGALYLAMAQAVEATPTQRERFFEIGQSLCTDQGADIVLLGGTDLFLAFEGHDCGFPVVDAADLHMDAIFRVAREGA